MYKTKKRKFYYAGSECVFFVMYTQLTIFSSLTYLSVLVLFRNLKIFTKGVRIKNVSNIYC